MSTLHEIEDQLATLSAADFASSPVPVLTPAAFLAQHQPGVAPPDGETQQVPGDYASDEGGEEHDPVDATRSAIVDDATAAHLPKDIRPWKFAVPQRLNAGIKLQQTGVI